MRRIRVLYFAHAFEQGGSERQLAELVTNLPRDRFEPYVAVCSARDDLGYDVPVIDLRSADGPSPTMFVRLVRLIRRLRPNIVHAVHDPQNSYARLAVRVAGVGVVVGSIRCTNLPARTIRRERLTHRLGRALIVNSAGIRDELVRRARIAPSGIDVVENGVDAVRFRPRDAQARAALRDRFEMRGFTFVVPARVAPQKNQLAVLNAVADLRDRGAWPDDALVIFAGRDSDAPYAERVSRAILMRGVSRFVRKVGASRDVELLLGAADVTLLPSSYEGLPNAVIESLACATPAIVSRAANTDSLVVDGMTGFVIDDLAEAMRRALDTSSSTLSTMGARGHEQTLARFGMKRMIESTCAIYERVIS